MTSVHHVRWMVLIVVAVFSTDHDYSQQMKCFKDSETLRSCCHLDTISFPYSDECEESFERLENSTGKYRKMNATAEHLLCIFKAKHIIKHKSCNVSENHLMTAVKEKYAQTDYNEAAILAVDECVNYIGELKTRLNRSGDETCYYLPFALNFCITRHIADNCPESKWSNSEHCDNTKSNATLYKDCLRKW
ncbi:CLUMA_CG001383, isoform A [Clunio marinus]|uniref:CLUMA_CG001383, isoform A n=1 Tax=Clunio marinus TaxID=568069 RepID=A0A1J1HJ47_9DIPT|nr:CLUMA_CG001383, isoform A [Clunio marinus]